MMADRRDRRWLEPAGARRLIQKISQILCILKLGIHILTRYLQQARIILPDEALAGFLIASIILSYGHVSIIVIHHLFMSPLTILWSNPVLNSLLRVLLITSTLFQVQLFVRIIGIIGSILGFCCLFLSLL